MKILIMEINSLHIDYNSDDKNVLSFLSIERINLQRIKEYHFVGHFPFYV